MRFGSGRAFGPLGKHFECRNVRGFWNDAAAEGVGSLEDVGSGSLVFPLLARG